MDRYELRRQDYSLSEEHVALQHAYRQFFEIHCPIDTVRAAETSGFDKSLWERLCAMGATTMALPETCGGDEATLVDLTLVAEEVGRSLAPVPWIDHVCATRLLARLGALKGAQAPALVNGEHIACMDTQSNATGRPALISVGSVADHIIVRDGESIIDLAFDTHPDRVDKIGRLPMARVDPAAADHRTMLGSGPAAIARYQLALDEWRLLTAAALVGLVEEAMTIAAEFAKTRYTLGVPIAALQAISHPLANMAITLQGGRNLTRRAAWFLENEPDKRPELAPSAFVFMAEEATKIAMMAAHIQGGLGVSAESAATSYLLRARGWPLAGGDPGLVAQYITDLVAAREIRDRASRSKTNRTSPVD
jgi:alkylation response protein AidB-like acyl-CoA dehydrogenase